MANHVGRDGEHVSFCRLCEAFCGTVVKVSAGKVVRITGDPANPHSRGQICIKGSAMAEIANDPERILHPLKRGDQPGVFHRISWDEALTDIAERLNRIRTSHGADALGFYLGNPCSISADCLMSSQWFFDRIGSKKFYSTGTQDCSSRFVANYITYGSAFRNGIPDLPNCELLLIIGANPLVSHGSLVTAPRIREDLDAITRRGRVIVIDPRRTETAARYEHLPTAPDSDVWLLGAMLRVIIDEDLLDHAFLDAHVAGWSAFSAAIATFNVADAARRSGIDAESITSLARSFARTERAAIYGRTGVCRGSFATLTNILLDALNICTGKFGRRGGWVFGAFALKGGASPFKDYGLYRSRIDDMPVVPGLMPGAVLPDDILEPGDGQIRAMIVVAGNPVMSAPGGARLETALQSLDLLVSCDIYVNETNRFADYILPATTILEKDDLPMVGLSHMIRPFVQYTPAVIGRMGEARNEFDIFSELARRMGIGSIAPGRLFRWLDRFGWRTRPMKLLDMALRLGPVGDRFGLRHGLSIGKLMRKRHGVMLDLPLSYTGWERYVATPDNRLRLWHKVVESEFGRLRIAVAAPIDTRLKLFSQRTFKSLNSWMHNTPRLSRSQTPRLLMNPLDSAERAIVSGDDATLRTAYGEVVVEVEVTTDVVAGAVCYPHGWGHDGGWSAANAKGGANINRLLPHGPGTAEQISGTSFMDGVPVEVHRRESPAVPDEVR